MFLSPEAGDHIFVSLRTASLESVGGAGDGFKLELALFRTCCCQKRRGKRGQRFFSEPLRSETGYCISFRGEHVVCGGEGREDGDMFNGRDGDQDRMGSNNSKVLVHGSTIKQSSTEQAGAWLL